MFCIRQNFGILYITGCTPNGERSRLNRDSVFLTLIGKENLSCFDTLAINFNSQRLVQVIFGIKAVACDPFTVCIDKFDSDIPLGGSVGRFDAIDIMIAVTIFDEFPLQSGVIRLFVLQIQVLYNNI